ncbi:hypothetical protein BBK82_03400 [Lentzea guizhouensis]|uniref:Uncharacterized protein n=1 Tax=Lentzea guizhouensis TaxID=1586287 RepID=A0A1B2HC03_9PSEU|nr:hypothetical protein BBK82_03400 [Lentzea guizhouensis]
MHEHHDDQPKPAVVVNVLPYEMPIWRAAEYGIDPGDLNTLVDIMLCERYVDPSVMQPENIALFNKPTIAEAREEFLGHIVATKLKYRMSTRNAEMNKIRQETTVHPADLALKTMGVILHRHTTGVQKLDPDVAKAFQYMQVAVDAFEQKQGA